MTQLSTAINKAAFDVPRRGGLGYCATLDIVCANPLPGLPGKQMLLRARIDGALGRETLENVVALLSGHLQSLAAFGDIRFVALDVLDIEPKKDSAIARAGFVVRQRFGYGQTWAYDAASNRLSRSGDGVSESRVGFKLGKRTQVYVQRASDGAWRPYIDLTLRDLDEARLKPPPEWGVLRPRRLRLSYALTYLTPDSRAQTARGLPQPRVWRFPRLVWLIHIGFLGAVMAIVANMKRWPIPFFPSFRIAVTVSIYLIGVGVSSLVRAKYGKLAALGVVLASTSGLIRATNVQGLSPDAWLVLLSLALAVSVIGVFPALVGLPLVLFGAFGFYRMVTEVLAHGLRTVPWQSWISASFFLLVGYILLRRQRMISERRSSAPKQVG